MKIAKSSDEVIKLSFNGYHSVIIPTREGKNTLCISCQIGCPVGCGFCRAGKFKRNLTRQEIISQFEEAEKILGKNPTTIVFMGTGEPTLNLENVLNAAYEIHKKGVAFRHITISTSGLKNLNKLLNIPFNVAVSLHSPFNKVRKELIPGAVSVQKIINFSKKYCQKHNKKVWIMIEYSMIKKINDSDEDLKKLTSMNWPKKTLFNLIEFNDFKEFKKSDEETMLKFKQAIIKKKWKCFIRKSRGKDIEAACGMLNYCGGE